MPPTLQELGIDKLSEEDRRAIALAIWESLDEDRKAEGLTREEWAELERRVEDSDANPGAGTPWEVVKARALARSGK